MPNTSEQNSRELDPAFRACLNRTRSAVLNVLLFVSLVIAISGWLLRTGAFAPAARPAQSLHRGLLLALLALAVTSYTLRRVLARHAAHAEPSRRESLFFWAHLLPAVVAALAAPLGFVYGWLVDPSLRAVSPFWVVALALVSLAFPRVYELEDFSSKAASS